MSPRNGRRRALAPLLLPALVIACWGGVLGVSSSACSANNQGASSPLPDAAAPTDATNADDDASSDADATTGCDAGRQICNGACVDLATDHDHCGACAVACPADHFCSAAQCHTCAEEGLQACGTGCADVLSDVTNCGACGHACAAGQQCQGGLCVAPPCPDGGSSCAGLCIDTMNDTNNCGGCGHACAAGQTCGGGACLCGDASTVACGATCLDPSTDHQHCGATPGCGINAGFAGLSCVSTGYCKGGSCQLCQSWSRGWSQALGGDAGLSWGSTFAASDFDNDTHPDLALLNRDTDTVTIYGGHADATFAAGASYSTISGATALAAGDFNGDGKQDFAVASKTSTGSTTPEYVPVWLGNGDGTFAPGPGAGRQVRADYIVAGDVNGDGRDDLVIAGVDASYASDVRVFLGQADGTFSVGANLASLFGVGEGSLRLSDLDGDGHLDLVVARYGPLVALFGKGDGTFEAPWTSSSALGSSLAAAVGDVNGDGRPDLLWQAVSNGQQGQWWIALNQGSRSFRYPALMPTSASVAILSDVTGDGILDFVGTDNASPITLYVLAGHGDGTFLPEHSFAYSAGYGDSLLAHDLNGDGYADIVGSTYSEVLVLLGSKAAEVECP